MPIAAIIGGVTGLLGGIGSLIGGKKAAKALTGGQDAASAALQPFNTTGQNANNLIAQLLGLGGGGGGGGGAGNLVSSPVAGSFANVGRFNREGLGVRENIGANVPPGFFGRTGGGAGGFSGGGGGSSPLDVFFKSAGGQFILDRGSEAITANQAASGLLNSGSTLKALTEFGSGVGSTFFQMFLQNLSALSSSGLSAGQSLAGVFTDTGARLADTKQNQIAGITKGVGSILGSIPTGGGGG